MTSVETDAPAITPSELVVLRPDALVIDASQKVSRKLFVGQDVIGPVPIQSTLSLFEGEPELPSVAWGLAMLTTALLAAEDQGQIVLELQETSRLAGLSTRQALVARGAVGLGGGGRWPWTSLEGQLRYGASPREVSDIVDDVLGDKSYDPAREALNRARANLVSRALVDEERERRWRFFVTSRYTRRPGLFLPPASTAAMLLQACSQRRPDIWKALNEDVLRGFSNRKKSDDYGQT